MNKKLLIISPYFPPVNAADMQRVRMSLPYFASCGWDAEIVTVDDRYTDMSRDELLLQSVPAGVTVHKVKALAKAWTAKIGLGSIALRSLWSYRRTVDRLLKRQHFDLIYFSTTQFPVCILGAYWKKRFGIRYVVDMQDPWHSDYYEDRPKDERPAKYWFSYRLNKYLEPLAMKQVGGLISVSAAYIADLKARYPEIRNVPAATITFSAFELDLQIAKDNEKRFPGMLDIRSINIVYIGRGGQDLHKALKPVFEAFQKGLAKMPERYSRIRFYFIGTSYAPAGQGTATILPLAEQYAIGQHVTEITDRISYYQTQLTLQQADGLFIPGSDDPGYTASKIFPYLLTRKPVLAIFNPASSAIAIMKQYGAAAIYSYDEVKETDLMRFFDQLIKGDLQPVEYSPAAVDQYSAKEMTRAQCRLFNEVIHESY